MAVIHSLWLSRVSRAKPCMCWTSLSNRYFNLGSGHPELINLTLSVMLSMVRSLRGGTSTWDGSMIDSDGTSRNVTFKPQLLARWSLLVS